MKYAKKPRKNCKIAHFVCGEQMSEESGQLKRADLRAFCGSVEGLYHLEGEVRNTGISEGFTGKE